MFDGIAELVVTDGDGLARYDTGLPATTAVLADPGTYLAAHPGLRDCYVSHLHPVADVQAAFSAAIAPRPGQLKIALDMT